MNTLEQVKAVIGDHAGIPSVLITDDQPLGKGEPAVPEEPHGKHTGLDFDSLDRIELAMKLGEHFGFEIPDEDVDRPELGTPEGIAAYVDQRLAAPLELTDEMRVDSGIREEEWLPPSLVSGPIQGVRFEGRSIVHAQRPEAIVAESHADALTRSIGGDGVIEVPGVGPVIEMDCAAPEPDTAWGSRNHPDRVADYVPVDSAWQPSQDAPLEGC
jgi:acyl carrier protein